MKVNEEELRHVANLARIDLSEAELKAMAEELKKVLVYFKKLDEVDTADVLPTTHALEVKNRFRPDVIAPSLDRDKVLENARSVKDGSFKVPQIIE